jgi:hypothetical protein
MQNHSVKNGFFMGLASVVFTQGLYFVNPKSMLTWGSYAGFLITLYYMIKAVRDTRTDNKGVLTISEGFRAGWLAYVLGAFISSVYMYILVNHVDSTLITTLKEIQIEAIETAGTFFKLPEDQLQEQISVIEDTNPFGLAQVALAIPFSFIFPGALIAIVIAAIMKKSDPNIAPI